MTVCHLVVIFSQGQSALLHQFSVTKVIFVTTRWQTDEEAYFSPSDTFKTRARQDSVTTRWQTEEEEHVSLLFKLRIYQWKVVDYVKKSIFQLQMPSTIYL